MKKQIRHFSKSTLAVVLTLCMLLSCFTAGIIASDAAKTESEVGARADSESVGAIGDDHEFNSGTLYIDASACSFFGSNGFAYSFKKNNNDWGTWVSQSATNLGNGIYSFDLTGIDSYLWIRYFRIVSKNGSGSAKATSARMTPPNNNTYNCIVLGSDGEGTWANYPKESNLTTTLYVKSGLTDTSSHSLTKAYIWEENNTNLAAWSGETISSSPWTSETINGYTYYKRVFANTWRNFQVILNDGNNQTNSSAENATGSTYYINEVNSSNVPLLSANPLSSPYSYYINGRFKVYNSTRTTESYTGDWSTTSKNIPFTETSTAGLYKVDTYKTIKELSTYTTNHEFYFFVGRATNGGTINAWYNPASGQNLTQSNSDTQYSVALANNNSNSFLFTDSSNTNTNYVTIYFNANTGKLYFHVDAMASYTVTLKLGDTTHSKWNDNTTADKTLTVSGATTLPTVTPGTGYQFQNWSVTNDGGGTATLANETVNGSATVTVDNNSVVLTANVAPVSETVVYVAKNDNISKIYAWKTSSQAAITSPFPGNSFDNSNQVYNIGGIEYYKFTVNTGTDNFSFVVNDGTNNGSGSSRQSKDATNYTAGHTYYVQWYGTGYKTDSVTNIGVDWYPKYAVAYKPSSAEDIPANWTRVDFSSNSAALNNLTAQNYVFYIVRQDKINGTYTDNQWYNTCETFTRSSRLNKEATHSASGNITLKADAPGNYSINIDRLDGDTRINIGADYPVGYRAVGNATFFGTAWDTTSSNYAYMFTQLATPYTDPDDNKVYTYSCSKTMDYSVGTFEFKAWDTNDTWYPAGTGGDIQVTDGVKRGQTITFYLNPTTGNVTYKITGEPSGESWPPSDIQKKMDADTNPLVEQNNTAYPEQYNTLIYKIATGSSAITSSPVTLTPLYQKTNPGTEGAWWADFTSVLPSIGTDQLYFNITSNGSYTGFYSNIANDGSSFDLTDAPGITVNKTNKDSTYYFVEVSGVESRVTNLGVYITKDASSNFTYKFYTIKGSASASKVVKVYAKDGAIRRLGTARDPKSNITYSTFEQYANTFVYSDSSYTTRFTGTVRASTHGATGNDELTDTTVFNRYTYDYIPSVAKGTTIYIKTVLKNDDYMNQYYLVGYSINGTVYQLHTVAESQTHTVTETFTIPTEWDYNYVEITPIYFLRSGTSIRFYVEGYDQSVMDVGWGNTVGVYPYYQDPTNNDQVANINNPFGGYPGQPMVFYKGNYYADIPKTYTAYTENSSSAVTCEIKGITLSNMYWDDVHLYTGEVSLHYQTYDFDDLYKIYKEYGNDVDNIICAFKYENRKNNDEPASFTNATSPATYTNGWELLKNYKGEAIDIFGSVLANQTAALALQPTDSAVHVISQDYKSNCAGQYATEYAVYNAAGTKVVESGGKTTIVPSALAIKTAANFDNYDPQTKAFKGIYSALKADTTNVVGKPVFITYEKSIFGGGDKADRCDARWFFSKKSDPADAKTRIEYSDNLGETWTTDAFNSGTATGSHSGSTAYFTGLSTEADNTPEIQAGNTTTTDTSANTNLDPCIGGGYYVFNATAGTGYKFVGWYILRDNYQLNAGASSYASGTTNFTSHAEIAKDGDIFVARFVKVTSGEFTINHRVHKDSTGFGDVYVQAVVKNSSGNTLYTYGATSGASATNTVTIPSSTGYIANNSGNTIEATFVPEPYGTSSFVNFYATVSDLLQGYNEVDYIKSIVINMPGVEGYDSSQGIYAKVTYDVNRMFSASGGSPTQTVSSVTHYSKFALKSDIPYLLKYTFKTRYYGNKTYTYSSTYTEAELRSYFYDQITTKATETIQLDKQFVQSKAPFESNYREDLTWVVDAVTFNAEFTEGYLTAHQEELKWSTAMVYDFTDDGSLVTHKMVAPYMKLFDASIQAKPSFESTDAEAEYIRNWSKGDGDLYYQTRNFYTEDSQSKPIYIERWDIYQLDSFTYKTGEGNVPLMKADGINLDVDTSKSKLVAQSFSPLFNYSGFEDYAIVPVYSKTRVHNQELSDTRTESSATLLTITRNHWNGTVSGNEQGGKYKDGADRIYVDFMLNYNYPVTIDGKTQNVRLSTTGDNVKVGFVIRSYTMVDGERVYRSNSQTVLVNKSEIDNKNRIEYCYGFNNTQNNSQWGLMFEFTPFIVDTNNQTGSTGANVTISGTTYKALNPIADADVLRGVNFYMIGNSDTDWN